MKAIWETLISALTLLGASIIAGVFVHIIAKCFMMGWRLV